MQVALFLLAVSLAFSVNATRMSLDKRATILANGTAMTYGSVSAWDLQWQASGYLTSGCLSNAAGITDCYSLSLSFNPDEELDPGFPTSPRQRIEFLTPNAADGESFTYTWKYRLSSTTGTTDHFFHLMQVFTDDLNGSGSGDPVITLDAVNGNIAIEDNTRGCTSTNVCPSIPITEFYNTITEHTMDITYGPSGSIDYTITNADTGATLLSYKATGSMGSGTSYLKMGTYRLAVEGMTVSNAAWGDFTSQQN